MKHKGSKKRIAIIAVNILLTAAALCCLLLMYLLPKKLISQQEAERWQGESEQAYAQTTVLSPRDEKMSINDVYSTRTKLMEKMHKAALDVNNDAELLIDAWSTNGKVSVYSGYGSGNVSALAVGGSYFDFHPITLLSGSYIGENDLMKDRVLLDEEVAWLLYGGTDLQGMSLSINNKNFYVAGVIRREEDFADKRAYSDGMGLYMSYDAYSELFPEAGITCYEVVMPQPVKNFARTAMEELFKGTDKAIIDNTSRFGLPALLRVARNFAERSIQDNGIEYPYWENAARYVEYYCAELLLFAMILLVVPLVSVVIVLVRLCRKGHEELTENLLPKAKDDVEEFIRVRGRRRWERRQGRHEKK